MPEALTRDQRRAATALARSTWELLTGPVLERVGDQRRAANALARSTRGRFTGLKSVLTYTKPERSTRVAPPLATASGAINLGAAHSKRGPGALEQDLRVQWRDRLPAASQARGL